MWIFTTSGFVSAVQDWNDTTMLVVRARDRKSLELLGAAASSEIVHTPTADYPYRLSVGKVAFSTWVAQEALAIDYPNFKSAVSGILGGAYGHALMDVWSAMHAVEDTGSRTRAANEPTSVVPAWVIRRIQQPCHRPDLIVPDATPIVSFGNPSTARVVTVAINPAPSAFTSGAKGHAGGKTPNPLLDLKSLNISDIAAMTEADAEKIARACFTYFDDGIPNQWFVRFEEQLLPGINASYVDGSACHLDLVQWATRQVWTSVPSAARQQLLERDAPFIAQQLRDTNYDVILLDGESARTGALGHLDLTLELDRTTPASGHATLKMYAGHFEDTLVLGWNIPLNGRLTNQARQELAAWVRDQFEIG